MLYKMIGINKLQERADIVRKNKKFAEKVEVILRDEAQEKEETKSQEIEQPLKPSIAVD